MRKLSFWIVLSVMVVSLGSCKGGKMFMPKSTGSIYELLVVMDSVEWKQGAGRALYDVLHADMDGLPQPEPMFRISYVHPDQFDNILKPVRNIVIVEIDDKLYTKASMKAERDAWAAPQSIMRLTAPNRELLELYVTNYYREIQEFFVKEEIARRKQTLEESYNTMLADKADSAFGITIKAPKEFSKFMIRKDFIWCSTGTSVSQEHIVIYSYPYLSNGMFTMEFQKQMRDAVMKPYIRGSFENSYMATEDAVDPEFTAMEIDGQYCAQMRGLWQMKGDMMGGPFIAHSYVDQLHQRIVTVEVFAFAPEKPKRNLMRSLEAILYTVKMPQPSEATDSIASK